MSGFSIQLMQLINMSIFMLVLWCFYSCSSVLEFEVRDSDGPSGSFITHDCFLAILVFLYFHMKLINVCSRSIKNHVEISLGSCSLTVWVRLPAVLFGKLYGWHSSCLLPELGNYRLPACLGSVSADLTHRTLDTTRPAPASAQRS